MGWQRTAREWAEYTKALSWDELAKVADALQKTRFGLATNDDGQFVGLLDVMNFIQLAADTLQQQEPEDDQADSR